MSGNHFYGWFDDKAQKTATYDPPFPAPCPLCGEPTSEDDVRTHNLMPADSYAPRSYFYRTHKTCSIKHGDDAAAEFIIGLIERRGD